MICSITKKIHTQSGSQEPWLDPSHISQSEYKLKHAKFHQGNSKAFYFKSCAEQLIFLTVQYRTWASQACNSALAR